MQPAQRPASGFALSPSRLGRSPLAPHRRLLLAVARLVFDLAGLGSRALFARMVVGRMDRMLEQVRVFLGEEP